MADGLKTGHTEAGGYGLVASAQRGGRRVIVVLNGMTSMHQRARGERAAAGMGVPRVRERDAVHRRRHGGEREGLARQPADRAAGGRAGPGAHHAAAVAATAPRSRSQYDARSRRRSAAATCSGKLTVSGQGVPAMEVPLLAGADVRPAGPAGARDGGAVALRDRDPEPRRVHHARGRRGGGQVDAGAAAGRARWPAPGAPVLRTREPGGAPGAEVLRAMLLGGAHRVVGGGRGASAFRRPRRAPGAHDPAGAGGGHGGGVRPVRRLAPWPIRATGSGADRALIAG